MSVGDQGIEAETTHRAVVIAARASNKAMASSRLHTSSSGRTLDHVGMLARSHHRAERGFSSSCKGSVRGQDRMPNPRDPIAAADFEVWWREYPRKCAKADARKAWQQTATVRPALLALIESTRRACRDPQWQRNAGQFIPYPATWLRGERWADEGVEREKISARSTGPDEADVEWSAVRSALRADDPRGLVDHRTRYAIAQIGWSALQAMRADQVTFMAREFARHFNAAPMVQRAQVHQFPEQQRRRVNG